MGVIGSVSELFVVNGLTSLWLAYLFLKKQRQKFGYTRQYVQNITLLIKTFERIVVDTRMLFSDQARLVSHSINTSVTAGV